MEVDEQQQQQQPAVVAPELPGPALPAPLPDVQPAADWTPEQAAREAAILTAALDLADGGPSADDQPVDAQPGQEADDEGGTLQELLADDLLLELLLLGGDLDAEDAEDEAAAAEAAPDFSTQDWEQPLYPGARLTRAQYVYALLREKRAGRMRDTVFNRLLKLLQSQVLPEGSSAPRSWHLFKKALGIEAAGKYEYHICQHGAYVFPKLPFPSCLPQAAFPGLQPTPEAR
jgi:hypothetical protein